MFGSELNNIEAQLKAMNYLLQEIARILQRLEDAVVMLPRCNCSDHQEGESWQCAIHGVVVRTKSQQ